MEKDKVGIRFGALCKPIAKQIKEQGFEFDEAKIKQYQKAADAIFCLTFNDLLPQSQADKCRQKLVTKIGKAVSSR